MNESDDALLARAAMKSLRVPAPEGLRADLKRLARDRKRVPSMWEGLREALSGGAFPAVTGAAFAAAAIGIILVRAAPERSFSPDVAQRPAQRLETATPQALRDLWSDDDGEDDDEI